MAEPNRGDSASARVLCEVVDEWLKVRNANGINDWRRLVQIRVLVRMIFRI